jgi:glycosyltransferase involved in cell wall biosynthesis
MLLSIIIPIYNVEKYIDRCLQSIFSQNVSAKDFEVICVNDGTPDNSMQIVKRYAEKYSNLHIINQPNQGLSVARNSGMAKAKGDYLWFVDSDDSVSPTSISEVIELINSGLDVDFISFDNIEIRSDVQTYRSTFTKNTYQKYYGKIHDGYFFCRKLPTGLSQKNLFSRKFLSDNKLTFTPGIFHEDQDFLVRCYSKAKKILPVHKAWYNYYIRTSGSITSTFKIKRFYDILKVIDAFNRLSAESNDYKEITVLQEGVFGLSYGLLSSRYRSKAEYKTFLEDNRSIIKRNLVDSYFRSFRKNSLGKTYRLIVELFS